MSEYKVEPRIAVAGRWAIQQLRDHLLFTIRAVASQVESIRGPHRRQTHLGERGVSYTEWGREA